MKIIALVLLLTSCTQNQSSTPNEENTMEQKLNLTQEWDKTFPLSKEVSHKKVTFHNRYGITLAADMYIPLHAQPPFAALAVSGPFGAVKEQSSGLYA